MLHCIVYVSHARSALYETDILAILEQSRRANLDARITGILLFVQGSIIQVLEGESAAVTALYQRIAQDQRHTDVTKILDLPISSRYFDDWSMGYKTLTIRQLELIKTVIDLQDADWLRARPSSNILLNMLKLFYADSQYN